MKLNTTPLAHNTWQTVEAYLKTRKTIILPIGSTEQHGPNGLIGIDYLTAQKIAEAVGAKTNTLVAPPICYGMAMHHMAFAGSASLRPTTLVLMMTDILQSFIKHGFDRILVINGHGGNIAPVTTAFCEIKAQDSKTRLQLENWWKIEEVSAYEREHFGDQNGFHATIGEVAATMYLEPQAYAHIPKMNFEIVRKPHHWPMGADEFRKLFADGRMESNPGLATPAHGEKIFNIAVNALSERLVELDRLT